MPKQPPPSTLHPAASFDDVSHFLRQDFVNEESRQVCDSVGLLAQHVNAAVRARRRRRDTATIALHATTLALGVREHQHFLHGLGATWQSLYEMAAYQRDLQALQTAVDDWQKALRARNPQEGQVFDRMEQLAWRTLGEGALLLDLFRQDEPLLSEPPAPRPAPPPPPRWAWWVRLRGWWRAKMRR
ncbi:MAG: hypothetical protein K2Q11_10365 [Burkholderiaceae bacterium]|nr:hypothetical protein [Burkholderiaceae bacterium]